MDISENNIKKLNKIIKQNEMNKIIEEIIKDEKKRKERIINLVSNTNYIEWLIEFTEDKEGFSDDDWNYAIEKLDDATQEKVNDLQLFFEGIKRYARKNYINSSISSLGECYQIRIGDIGFEIGYLSGQGTKFYCRRIPLEKMENDINFMDIVNNKKQDNVEYIEKSLRKLSNVFIELYNNGVPVEAMMETFNMSMNDIVKQERDKNYIEEEKTLKKML